MKSNIKIVLNDMMKDLSKTFDTTLMVLDKDNRVLIVEGKNEGNVAIGDMVHTKCRFNKDCKFCASTMLDNGMANLCTKKKNLNMISYDRVRVNFKDILKELEINMNDLNTLAIPLGKGSKAIGVIVIVVSDMMKDCMRTDSIQGMLGAFNMMSNLVVDKYELVNDYEIRPIEDVEKEMMITALKRIGNSSYDINIISDKLGMNRSTFYRKCKKYDINIQNIWR